MASDGDLTVTSRDRLDECIDIADIAHGQGYDKDGKLHDVDDDDVRESATRLAPLTCQSPGDNVTGRKRKA